MSLINRLKPLVLGLMLSSATIAAFSGCETLKLKSSKGNEEIDYANKKRIYITAFGPFKDYQRNPTQDIASYLSKKGYTTETLDVDYHKAPERLRQIIMYDKPDVIVSFGFSEKASNLALSITAKNIMSSDFPDNSGRIHKDVKINDKLPDILSIDEKQRRYFRKMARQAGINYYEQDDADSFVCNSLSFAGISETKGNTKTSFYFFHVPADIYSNKQQLRNLEKIIRMLEY